VMQTVGLPGLLPSGTTSDKSPYGIFGSDATKYSGSLELDGKVLYWAGSSWTEADTSKSQSIGIYAAI
jgi:hypothetical protein